MKETKIALSSLVSVGHVCIELIENALRMTTTHALHDVGYNIRREKLTSYLALPGAFHLPFRLDVECRIDSPEMLVLIGDGHVTVGSPWMENRNIEDILEPTDKPKRYPNHILYGEWASLSLIFNLDVMQICINGEERYFTTRERYMKSALLPERNAQGFAIGLTCTKRALLDIRSVTVTEFDDAAPFVRSPKNETIKPAPLPGSPQKPTFDSCIASLPEHIRTEIARTKRI